jgi:hypothetical protein
MERRNSKRGSREVKSKEIDTGRRINKMADKSKNSNNSNLDNHPGFDGI